MVSGNLICRKHRVYLIDFEIPKSISRYYYDVTQIDVITLNIVYIENNLKDYFFNPYVDIDFVLNGDLSEFNINLIKERYRQILQEKGYLLDDRIKQSKLESLFLECYPSEFLEKLESLPSQNDKRNWLRKIATNEPVRIHPIKHLLFIRILFGSVQEFVNYRYNYKPFEKAPWVCLNQVADRYMEHIIKVCEIKRVVHSINKPTGVFLCDCGFNTVEGVLMIPKVTCIDMGKF